MTYTKEKIDEAAKAFGKQKGKQIMGETRVQHRGQEGVTCFTLEDGSQVFKTDGGKAAKSFKKLPPRPKRVKREVKERL